VLDAALALAISGGMSAMQTREVAERAGVSTRTVHVHFPTKNHLLLSALVERGAQLTAIRGTVSSSRDPARRVLSALKPPTDALLAVPELARAIVVALVDPDPRALPVVRAYRDQLYATTVRALRPRGEQTQGDEDIARTLVQVWFAAVIGWASGIEDRESIAGSVKAATARLLAAPSAPQASGRG
jgi:AcrR family transcriptional regulator